MNSIIKHPSAWLPIVISLLVLATILITITVSGPPSPQPDEGVGAHLFQIWLALEVLMIAFFAIQWLPKKPEEAVLVLVIQIVAVLAACAPVFYFHL